MCRPPVPATFTRQRRGWATRHLVVESEPGADSLLPAPGGSASAQHASTGTPGSSASQCLRLWIAGSTPSSWLWGGTAAGGAAVAGERRRGRVLRRQSTCQLELDASVDAILNRQQVWQIWCAWHLKHAEANSAACSLAPPYLTGTHGISHHHCSWCACRWHLRGLRFAWWKA